MSQEIDDQEQKEGTTKTPPPSDPSSPRGPVKLTFLRVGSAEQGNEGAGDRKSGSHVAQVTAEIHDATVRNVTSEQIIRWWREKAGQFPGAERVTFQAANIGPGGKPLEFKILSSRESVAQLEAAVEEAKATDVHHLAVAEEVLRVLTVRDIPKWFLHFLASYCPETPHNRSIKVKMLNLKKFKRAIWHFSQTQRAR
jgi:hypothetical protein